MNKNTYIQEICKTVRLKSSCAKRKVGSVFVNEDYEILATGFNESPRGFEHCDAQPIGKPNFGTCGDPCTRTIHSEQNAIVQAAKRGVKLKGSILFCTYMPCITCAKLLVNLQVSKVYVQYYNNDGGDTVLNKAAIAWELWNQK